MWHMKDARAKGVHAKGAHAQNASVQGARQQGARQQDARQQDVRAQSIGGRGIREQDASVQEARTQGAHTQGAPRLRKQGAAKRCGRACLAICIALAIIPLSGYLASFLSGTLSFSTLLSADEQASCDGYSTETGFDASTTAAQAFASEIMSPDGLSDMRANEDCSVVGFVVEGGAAQALAQLSKSVEQRGWVSVDSGSDTMKSFVKSSGEYTWLFANCVEVGDETSVVLCAY